MQGPVRLRELLKRRVFQGAVKLTGDAGLARGVRWIHVLESEAPQGLIHGGELVLTTAIAFRQRPEAFAEFVRSLIKLQAAGICIELGTAIDSISENLIAEATESDFALVVFPHTVRFVDITQDIHGLLLSRHHRILDDLEELNSQLHLYLTGRLRLQGVLLFVAKVTGALVVYQDEQGNDTVMPTPGESAIEAKQRWAKALKMVGAPDKQVSEPYGVAHGATDGSPFTMLYQPIRVLGVPQGFLYILVGASREDVDESVPLVLDRTSSALAHEAFRRLSLSNRQWLHEQDSVEELLHGTPNPAAILKALGMSASRQWYVAIVAPVRFRNAVSASNSARDLSDATPYAEGWNDRLLDVAMAVRLSLAGAAFPWAFTIQRTRIVFILQASLHTPWKADFEQVIPHLQETLHSSGLIHSPLVVTVSSPTDDPADIRTSHLQAEHLQDFVQREIPSKTAVYYYEDFGIYRWLWLFGSSSEDVNRLAASQLAPLKNYDRGHDTNLLQTLRVYLDCERSKSETAHRLSIHRQTLYHRLSQIENLLRTSLDNPVLRLSIHLALYAMDLT